MRDVFILLPTQAMDSLSLRGTAEDCQELLAAWTCVYHPEVLRLTRKTATPMYGLYIYEEPENIILIAPKPTMDILDPYWVDRAESRNCTFLRDCSDLNKLTEELIRCLREDATRDAEKEKEAKNTEVSENGENTESETEVVTENVPETEKEPISGMPEVADFMALGMMHLLSEVMAHKLQFMSYLDSFSFTRDVLTILDSMDAGDVEKAKRDMQMAWDQLVQSRQYYAPQDGYLFDLTLLDTAYLPASFQNELESATEMNLMADGAVIAQMAETFPAMLDELKKGLDAKKVCLVGGEETETEFPLLTQEGILRRLQHGLEVYEKWLGKRPEIYARRKFGLTPMLPNVLKKLGFQGALHFTLDDGKFPVSEQTRIAWKGTDGQVIETISKIPLDAQKADATAGLPEELAKSLNVDNAFGAIFTHWAGEGMTSEWYELLKRSCRWIPLFGSMTTFAECFDATRYSSSDERFLAESYVSPYLSQYVAGKEADPISRWSRYHQLRARFEALAGLECMARWLNPKSGTEKESVSEKLLERLEACRTVSKDFFASAWQEMLTAERKVAEEISAILSDGNRKNALLVLNPASFTAEKAVDLSETEKNLSVSRLVPEENGPIKKHYWEKYADSRGTVHGARVEVPSFGFALVTDSPEQSATPPEEKSGRGWLLGRKKTPQLPPPVYQDAESGMWLMTNEHLTLRFDPYTGHLRSVYDNIHRGNRFSQQLAMRRRATPLDSLAEEAPDDYSLMAADSFRPGIFADRCEMEISGRLMDRRGEILAKFTQTTTLRRGSSVVEFDVFLEPLKELGRNPWQSYYASRMAWGDSTVDLFRNVGFSTQPASTFKVEAPYFVEVRPIHYATATKMMSTVSHELAQRVRGRELRSEDFLPERGADTEYTDARLTLLANGLPWHRNCGNRRLDTLLVVQGESSRRFRFGVAVNAPYPMKVAQSFMAPMVQVPVALKNGVEHSSTGWFGFVSRKNVVVTHWQAEENGARIRFAETEGRNVRVSFRALHPLELAEQIDFLGERQNTLAIEEDQIQFEIFAHEFKEIRIRFRK